MPEMPGSEQVCHSCDRVVGPMVRICSCGRPTALANFKERIDWELKQWRAYKAKPLRAR